MHKTVILQRMKPILPIIVGVLVFLLLFGSVLWAHEAESHIVTKEFGEEEVAGVSDYMVILVKLVSVDPIKGEMTSRLLFYPQGALVDDADGTLKVPLIVDANTEAGKPELIYAESERMNPVEIVESLYDGDVMRYPFDSHHTDLVIGVFIPQPAKEDGEKQYAAVPARVEFVGALPGFSISAEDKANQKDGYVEIGVQIGRSPTSIFFAVFIMILLWLLALVALSVTLSCLITGRKIEATLFSWMAALLFAMLPLRNAMPGVPPIGAYSDYLSFFWAEILVALSLVVFVYTYLSRPVE